MSFIAENLFMDRIMDKLAAVGPYEDEPDENDLNGWMKRRDSLRNSGTDQAELFYAQNQINRLMGPHVRRNSKGLRYTTEDPNDEYANLRGLIAAKEQEAAGNIVSDPIFNTQRAYATAANKAKNMSQGNPAFANLNAAIKARNSAAKDSDDWKLAQNFINEAYNVKKRYDVTGPKEGPRSADTYLANAKAKADAKATEEAASAASPSIAKKQDARQDATERELYGGKTLAEHAANLAKITEANRAKKAASGNNAGQEKQSEVASAEKSGEPKTTSRTETKDGKTVTTKTFQASGKDAMKQYQAWKASIDAERKAKSQQGKDKRVASNDQTEDDLDKLNFWNVSDGWLNFKATEMLESL